MRRRDFPVIMSGPKSAIATPAPADPIGDGLRADAKYCWTFDQLVSGKVIDKTGRNNDLTNNGGTIGAGAIGNAIYLNGTDQYLSADNTTDFQVADNDFTIAVLYKVVAYPTNPTKGRLITKTNYEYLMAVDSSGQLYGEIPDGEWNAPSVSNPSLPFFVSLGEWHLSIFIHKSSPQELHLYYDNVLSESGSMVEGIVPGQLADTGEIRVGCGGVPGNYNNFLNGAINFIGKWNRILSVEELTYLYNDGTFKILY